MIKAIFFDFDGVLTLNKSGHTLTWDSLADKLGIEADVVYNCVEPHNGNLYEGHVKLADIWEELTACMKTDISIDVMNDIYHMTPKNEVLYTLVNKLRDTYFLGIITDNMEDRVMALTKKFELDTLFSDVQISGVVGSGKHTSHIFELALQTAGIAPEEAIFIDNKEGNLVAAKSLGMATYYFDDSKNDVRALELELLKLGISI